MNTVVLLVEEEIGIRELLLDNIPQPVHWGTKGDVYQVCWSRPTGEKGNESAEGVDDDRSTIPVPGEWTRITTAGVDCHFHGIVHAYAEVMANVRLKARYIADSGERGEAMFDNAAEVIAFEVSGVGVA